MNWYDQHTARRAPTARMRTVHPLHPRAVNGCDGIGLELVSRHFERVWNDKMNESGHIIDSKLFSVHFHGVKIRPVLTGSNALFTLLFGPPKFLPR